MKAPNKTTHKVKSAKKKVSGGTGNKPRGAWTATAVQAGKAPDAEGGLQPNCAGGTGGVHGS